MLIGSILVGLGVAIWIMPILYGLGFGYPIAASPAPLLITILGVLIVMVGIAIPFMEGKPRN